MSPLSESLANATGKQNVRATSQRSRWSASFFQLNTWDGRVSKCHHIGIHSFCPELIVNVGLGEGCVGSFPRNINWSLFHLFGQSTCNCKERTNNYFLLKEHETYWPWSLWFGLIHFYYYTSNLYKLCVCLWLLMARMEVVYNWK